MRKDTGSSNDTRRPRWGRLRFVALALGALVLAGCQADEEVSYYGRNISGKHLVPLAPETRRLIAEKGMDVTSPVLMRIFKQENTFEIWKKDRSGRYALLKSFEICKWSGKLGPKIKEGDRQAPEGYYQITPGLMNPNSSYFLAFNTGFPNAFDRAHGRTGAHLMVHGACSSRGCYAMSDAQMQEIYALARDAFRGGQTSFQLQAYPFRMTPENLARHMKDPNMPFWRMLKEGYDHFELTRQEPKVDVCGRKYVFNVSASGAMSPAAPCPALTQPESIRVAAAAKAKKDDAEAEVLFAKMEAERIAEEERQIAAAQAEEERKRRAEERAIAAAERSKAIASALSVATGGIIGAAPDLAPTAEELGGPPPTAAPDGSPLPRPVPQELRPTAMALAPEAAPATSGGVGSVFGKLFSFGEDDNTLPPAPTTPATTTAAPTIAEPAPEAPVATAPATTPAAPAATPAAAARPAAPPQVVTPPVATAPPPAPASPTAAAPQAAPPAAVPPGAACATPGSPANGLPPCPPTVEAPPVAVNAEDRNILNRIGNWF